MNAPALGCNGYITCLEQNRHLLSKLTKTWDVSPVVTLFWDRSHQSTFLGELYIFGFFPDPPKGFAFSGSQKLKNPLASQGRRLEAGVAKDWGGSTPRHVM